MEGRCWPAAGEAENISPLSSLFAREQLTGYGFVITVWGLSRANGHCWSSCTLPVSFSLEASFMGVPRAWMLEEKWCGTGGVPMGSLEELLPLKKIKGGGRNKREKVNCLLIMKLHGHLISFFLQWKVSVTPKITPHNLQPSYFVGRLWCWYSDKGLEGDGVRLEREWIRRL